MKKLLVCLAFLAHTNALADQSFEQSLVESITTISEKAQEFRLSNGIPVIIFPRGEAPIFSGVVSVRAGGIDEELGSTGISHMFEHMAFKGSENIGTKDYAKEKVLLEKQEVLRVKEAKQPLTNEEQLELNKIEAELQTLWEPNVYGKELSKRGSEDLNASTSKELTRYWVSLPRPSFEFWCWLEAERLIRPIMREFYTERDVVLEERRMRYENDPQGKLYEALLLNAFTIHPYRNPVIGYEQDLRKLTASQLTDFWKKRYVAENIAIGIAGDISKDDIDTIEKYFGKIRRAETPTLDKHPAEPEQLSERRFKIRYHSAPQLALAYHKPVYPHPDDPAISLLEEILAGSKISPLIQRMVKERTVVQSVDVFEDPGFLYPNLVQFWMNPLEGHSAEAVIKIFDEELEAFIKRGPTAEEMAVAKRSFAVDQLKEFNSNLSLATNLSSNQLIYGDWRMALSWLKDVMMVTDKQVVDAATRYLRKENRTVAILESSR